jgi:SAM-dependent methyltransferase
MPITYHPSVFDVTSIAQAMGLILTPEGSTTNDRWATETPYLADLLAQNMTIGQDTLILDYGCGVGRLARELINRHGCFVIGVDISPSMRTLSIGYTRTDRFMSCSQEMLDGLVARGLVFDFALSIWVLQHCLKPAEDIACIRNALRPGGGLFVVNGNHRAVPTAELGWYNDGLDVNAMLNGEFEQVQEGKLAREKTTEILAPTSFWGAYRRAG